MGTGRLSLLRSYLFPTTPQRDPRPGRRTWLYAAFVLRRWLVEDRCGGLAAILTIDTLLSTVPVVGIALLAVNMMDPDSGAALLQDIFGALVPETSRAEGMARIVLEYGRNVSVARLGTWGFLLALAIAFVLFSALEKTFNRIWRVRRTRNIFVKFTMFYAIATLGPLLLLYSLAQPVVASMSQAFASPILTTTAAMVLLNRLMPFTRVWWQAAIAGGLLSAILFESGKWVFGLYLTRVALETYTGLYGPLAILPILVVWSFISWMMVLLGAELAFVIQHRRAIALQGYVNPYLRDAADLDAGSGRTAARLLLAICDAYDRHGAGATLDGLAERFKLPLDRVGGILGNLEHRGFVLEVERPSHGYVPGRPLDHIRVLDVLSAFDDEATRNVRDDRLSNVFTELDDARAKIVSDLTYHDLIALRRAQRPEPDDDAQSAEVVELDAAD